MTADLVAAAADTADPCACPQLGAGRAAVSASPAPGSALPARLTGPGATP